MLANNVFALPRSLLARFCDALLREQRKWHTGKFALNIHHASSSVCASQDSKPTHHHHENHGAEASIQTSIQTFWLGEEGLNPDRGGLQNQRDEDTWLSRVVREYESAKVVS